MGAASPGEAKNAAMTVALSPLVKTAMAGEDVNWGRIMAALGRCRGPLRPRAGGYRLRRPPRGAKRPGPGP